VCREKRNTSRTTIVASIDGTNTIPGRRGKGGAAPNPAHRSAALDDDMGGTQQSPVRMLIATILCLRINDTLTAVRGVRRAPLPLGGARARSHRGAYWRWGRSQHGERSATGAH
jgi:hypothetical protein